MDWNKRMDLFKAEHRKDARNGAVEASVSYTQEDDLLIRTEVWDLKRWEKSTNGERDGEVRSIAGRTVKQPS